jgi:hypothetical protein
MKKMNTYSVNDVSDAFNNTQELLNKKIKSNPEAIYCYNLATLSAQVISMMNEFIREGKGNDFLKDIKAKK